MTALNSSFRDCWKNFKYSHLSEPSQSFIQKVANELGNIGISEENRLLGNGKEVAIQQGKTFSHEIFAVMLDGGRCLLRELGISRPQWREVKVGAFVDYVKGKDKLNKIIPIRTKTNYIGRIKENSQIFGERLWLGALAKGYDNSNTKVFLGDGAKYNWDIWEYYFPDSIAILDWYHATEHLAKVSKLIFGEKKENYNDWYEARKEELYNGQADKIAYAMNMQLVNISNKEIISTIQTEIGYFLKNKERIFYKKHQDAGLPIGSGVIEGGIKQVVNKRLKGTEKQWIKKNGDNILKLKIDEVGDCLHDLCQLYEMAA